jgi:hypothetical protein
MHDPSPGTTKAKSTGFKFSVLLCVVLPLLVRPTKLHVESYASLGAHHTSHVRSERGSIFACKNEHGQIVAEWAVCGSCKLQATVSQCPSNLREPRLEGRHVLPEDSAGAALTREARLAALCIVGRAIHYVS